MEKKDLIFLCIFLFICAIPAASLSGMPEDQPIKEADEIASAIIYVSLSVDPVGGAEVEDQIHSTELRDAFIDQLNQHLGAPSLRVRAVVPSSDLSEGIADDDVMDRGTIHLLISIAALEGDQFSISLFSRLGRNKKLFRIYAPKAKDKTVFSHNVREILMGVAVDYAQEVNCMSGGQCLQRKGMLP